MGKVYLDRLKERYGWTGGKYRQLMDWIIANNHESVQRAVGRVKVSRLKEEGKRLARRKKQPAQVSVPELDDVLPKRSVFIRKGAEQGKLLSDTLRTRLSKDLRGAVSEFLDRDESPMQYQRGERRGRMRPELIDRFQSRITKTFEGYTKTDPEIGVPPNVRAIAVTETRSAIDDIKHTYAKRLIEKNPGARAIKRWKHNTHLVSEPRPGHKQVDGRERPLDKPFRIRQYRKVGTKTRGPNKGAPKWQFTGQFVYMQHPHEPGQPPEEVIGCQCEVDYLYEVPTQG